MCGQYYTTIFCAAIAPACINSLMIHTAARHHGIGISVCSPGSLAARRWNRYICSPGGQTQWNRYICGPDGQTQWNRYICGPGSQTPWNRYICRPDSLVARRWNRYICSPGSLAARLALGSTRLVLLYDYKSKLNIDRKTAGGRIEVELDTVAADYQPAPESSLRIMIELIPPRGLVLQYQVINHQTLGTHGSVLGT